MLNRIVACGVAFIFGAASMFAGAPAASSAKLDVSQPTAIPGSVLEPGTYTLHIVDHLSDRYILGVEGPGKHASFLGIPNPALKAATGKVSWAKSPDDKQYLKGWNFAGSPGALEFVYPKDDAVALAKANQVRVAAIDPASEGRVSNNGLSKEDMQMVTLWLLSPTHVGPGDAGGIKAERYAQVAKLTQKPVVASLPHTAGILPLSCLIGLVALAMASGFTLRRRMLF